ncbi:MAG: CoA pyrophosphatase [Candidatus Eremiobacteraeota bacterium]|nr:CoA pyrophosphatase [Candidatus Eremiobacteraeota bacterium]
MNARPRFELRREAAVMVTIFRDAPHGVIFVERAAHLRDHPGQIGLPGGGVHAEDADLEATALRELHEEVGIERSGVTVVARLPTISQHVVNNFDVTPFVAVCEAAQLRIDPAETAGAFLVPLETIVGGLGEYGLDFEGRRIWGLTARILHAFVTAWREHGLEEKVRSHLR